MPELWRAVLIVLGGGATLAAAYAADHDANNGRSSLFVYALCAGACVLVIMTSGSVTDATKAVMLAALLSFLTIYDLRVMAIPVWPTLAGVAVGLAWAGAEGHLLERLFAAACGASAFLALSAAYKRWRGVDGMGSGDALIAALIGAWVSFEGLAWSVAAGGALGLLFSLATGRDAKAPAPFAPALSAGVGVYWVLGGVVA